MTNPVFEYTEVYPRSCTEAAQVWLQAIHDGMECRRQHEAELITTLKTHLQMFLDQPHLVSCSSDEVLTQATQAVIGQEQYFTVQAKRARMVKATAKDVRRFVEKVKGWRGYFGNTHHGGIPHHVQIERIEPGKLRVTVSILKWDFKADRAGFSELLFPTTVIIPEEIGLDATTGDNLDHA